MIKELEEAKQAIEDIIFNRTTAQYYMTRVDQILNLKGENWKLGIIGIEEWEEDGIKMKLHKIVWQAEE